MKRILSLILLISIFAGLMPVAFAADYTWETGVYITYDGRSMPFKPQDKYTSMQNPPDFSWPYVNDATSYDLKICSDEALNNIVYEKKGLTNNYYNFDRTFETGTDYWWSVKYYKSGSESEWSAARRFRVDPDAYEFIVPEISVLLDKVPSSHPRIFTTKDKLAEFRAIKEDNEKAKTIYDDYVKSAEVCAASGVIPPEPVLNPEYWDAENNTYVAGQYENYFADLKRCKSGSGAMLSQLLTCGFAYLLTGSEYIGNYAKNLLLALTKWDIEGPSSYTFDDQVHREVIYKSAMVYDWIFDLLSETEAKTVRDMIVKRITYVYKKANGTSCIGNLMTSLKKDPYDSHGWTAIGYLGIAAYALMGDFGEEADLAKEWMEIILPLYTAVMHPWSTEDGGWSQGTDYWKYSTQSSKEFIDILAIGGIINLYEKAWAKNEPLWTMYAFPKGSYGSFGDGSNRVKAESTYYTRNSLGKVQYFADDSVARWLSLEQGTLSNDMTNYIVSTTMDEEAKAPAEYPLAHEFKDIGWAVMTNDLEDENRVQLTFKSSPYGSFNHSHADQNSFIIQAFGENLAIKSGYYDYYHSPHDSAITRATFAHNSVTMDGGYGQQDDRFDTKGKLSQFASGLEFDSVTGEAASAYKAGNLHGTSTPYSKALDRFDRNIIYIRPDVFIVVDDLDAAGESLSSFEWWLNAEHEMEYGANYALISEGDARLKANVLYPETTAKYYDTFESPVTKAEYTPTSGYESANVQTRVSFATDAVQSTKMVVSMSVYEDGGSAKEPAVSGDNSSYIKLDYGDTAVYVSLLDTTETVVTGDGITFKGAAVTLNDTSIMLTNGTYLKKDQKELISADRAVTASMGIGQICLSSDDDYNVTVDVMNDYLTVTDAAKLKDGKGRALSAAVGIIAEYNAGTETDTVELSARKGNYTILNGDAGVVSPGQLKVENTSYLKSIEDKAAIYWTKKEGRSYDIKIDDTVFEDAGAYPYVFDLTDNVNCVYVREKLGKIEGSWSEPLFVSKYEKVKFDTVKFSEVTENEKTFVKAEVGAFSPLPSLNMYLAKYDAAGKFIGLANGEAANNTYSAVTEKPESGMVKAFWWADNIEPIMPEAIYGNDDCTDLLGIYADGKLIDGFDNEKDFYELTFEKGQKLFPYITAVAADSSSKAEVEYDFENFTAEITVETPKGTKRTVTVKYSDNMDDIHMVYSTSSNALMTFAQEDAGVVTEDNGKGWISDGVAGRLYYDKTEGGVTTPTQFGEYHMYGDLHGNSGGDLFGSRLFTDRAPVSGNHMELVTVEDNLKGFDYFVLPHGDFFGTLESTEYPNKYFWFRVAEDVEVVILSHVEQDSLVKKYGFSYAASSMYGRYMNTAGTEDAFYNIDILGRDASEAEDTGNSGYYVKNYDIMNQWVNVNPISAYEKATDAETWEAYRTAFANGEISKDSFTVVGSASSKINASLFTYNHKYTKVFDVDENAEEPTEIKIYLDDIKEKYDSIIIIVKPVTPAPFYEK